MVLAPDGFLEAECRRLQGGTPMAQSKYPGWEDSWGVLWDEIIKNLNSGGKGKTLPDTLPALCNLTQLPIGTHWDRHHIECFRSEYNGRTYYFDSDVSKWCFDLEPARYAGHLNVVDSVHRRSDPAREPDRGSAMDGNNSRRHGRRRIRLSLGG